VDKSRSTVVVLSTTDWDAPQFGSRQQIAQGLARRGYRVLFADVPRALHSLISAPADTRRALGRMARLRPVENNLVVYTPLPVLPIYYHPWTNAVNQRLICRDLRHALRRLEWQPDLLITYWPTTAYLVGRLGQRASIYHCIDALTAVRYPLVPPGAIRAHEAELCRRVDLVVARTEELAADKRRFNPNTVYLPGGVDTTLFDPARLLEPSPAIASLPRPRVGFVGTIDDRVDVDLLTAAARSLPDVTFVLAGPQKRHLVDLRPLEALPNVRFLPALPHPQVPALVAGFDVCLIPYRVNPYTEGLSPLKLYEYLAMGKPVIATNLPYLRREADTIHLAQSSEAFIAALRLEVTRVSSAEERARRRKIAEAHTWARQVDTMEQYMTELLATNPDAVP